MSDKTEFKVKLPAQKKEAELEEKHPCLIVIAGYGLGTIYPLEESDTIIGRDETAGISIFDTNISRQHALVEYRDMCFWISDLGSTNGTTLNDQALTHRPHKMEDGDRLQMGNTILKFVLQNAEETDYLLQLRDMAIKDELTQVYNKRFFLTTLTKEVAHAQRTGNMLSLIIFDIDFFKKINDTYGHPTGDAILRQLAALLKPGIRNYDTFARYGGEEFVCLLRSTKLANAVIFANRMREKVANHNFAHENQTLKVSISLGVSSYDGKRMPFSESTLINEADQQLYRAKQAGRNRVCYDPALVE